MLREKQQLLNEIDLFVLDMDGTFYLGEQLLEGALEFLQEVERLGKRFIFFTNNSSKSPQVYIEKLEKMDCKVALNQIMTSADVTIQYLKKYHPEQSVYLLGTPILEADFVQQGICLVQEQPDVVVVAFDLSLTYEKLARACTYIRNGAVFLATHLDINCPTETGFIPDCGAICAAISLSTGAQSKYLGKPFPETMDMILQITGAKKEKVAFVGDRLYTDVATGVKNGAKGILVLTGETREEDVKHAEFVPDAVFASLKEMGDVLHTL